MAFGLGDNQKVTLSIVGTDSEGNPSITPEGPFTWIIEDPALLQILSVSDDTLTAVIKAVGPLGLTNVVVSNGNLQGVGELSVVSTEPVSLTVISGTPEPK